MKNLILLLFLFTLPLSAQQIVSKNTPSSNISSEQNEIILEPVSLIKVSDDEVSQLSSRKKEIKLSEKNVAETNEIQLSAVLKPVSEDDVLKLSKQKKSMVHSQDNNEQTIMHQVEIKAKLIPID